MVGIYWEVEDAKHRVPDRRNEMLHCHIFKFFMSMFYQRKK